MDLNNWGLGIGDWGLGLGLGLGIVFKKLNVGKLIISEKKTPNKICSLVFFFFKYTIKFDGSPCCFLK